MPRGSVIGVLVPGQRVDASRNRSTAERGHMQLTDAGELIVPRGRILANLSDTISDVSDQSWDGFRRTMRDCAWTTSSVRANYSYATQHMAKTCGPNWGRFDNDECLEDQGGAAVESCEADAAADDGADVDGSKWLAQRIGPIHSSGGYDWHEFKLEGWPALTQMLNEQSEVWVTGLSTLAVDPFADSSTEVLRYPRIHNHHSHVIASSGSRMDNFPAFSEGVYQRSIILNHQDRVCALSEDYRCMLTLFPPGHGVLLIKTVDFFALFNDARDAKSSSMSWRVETALRILPIRARTALRPVDMWYGTHFYTDNAFGTFAVPSQLDSVAWTQVVADVSGTILSIWMHTHGSKGHLETWFFDAPSTALGLDVAPFVQPDCSPFVPADHALTLTAIKSHIVAAANTHRAPLRCVATTPQGLNYGALGDRQPIWRCYDGVGQTLVAGTNMTVISFFRRSKVEPGSTPYKDGRVYALQHQHFQVYLVRSESTSDPQPFHKYGVEQLPFKYGCPVVPA